MGRRSTAFSTSQIEEMIRLRSVERLTRRQIVERMGVSEYRVKAAWRKLPMELRGHLPESCKRPARWAARSRMGPVGEGQCVSCGMIFDEANPEREGRECLLCELQKDGLTIVY